MAKTETVNANEADATPATPGKDAKAVGRRPVPRIAKVWHADRSAQEAPAWLRSQRDDAWSHFERHGFPAHKVDDWKNSPVAALAKLDLDVAAPASADHVTLAAAQEAFTALHGHALDDALPFLVVDGQTHAHRTELPSGVRVLSLAEALADPEAAKTLADQMTQVATHEGPEHAFVALNTAFLRDAIIILIDDDIAVEHPLHVIHVATRSANGAHVPVTFPRTFIHVGRNASATIVQTHLGLDATVRAGTVRAGATPQRLVMGTTELVAGEGANVHHIKLQDEDTTTAHIAPVFVTSARDATVHDLVVSTGGRWVRNETRAILTGEGAEVHLDGIYLTAGAQHMDHHTVIDHRVPHGTSTETYKGVLDGESHAAFLGRIIVAEGARQTNSEQENRNLLLSKKALADTTPQLEIYNDDVKCAHGSTVGRLDETAVFFLRSRGIGDETARRMLTEAFLGEVIEDLPQEALVDGLRARIHRWFDEDRHA